MGRRDVAPHASGVGSTLASAAGRGYGTRAPGGYRREEG